jgi:hypothetical protein
MQQVRPQRNGTPVVVSYNMRRLETPVGNKVSKQLALDIQRNSVLRALG